MRKSENITDVTYRKSLDRIRKRMYDLQGRFQKSPSLELMRRAYRLATRYDYWTEFAVVGQYVCLWERKFEMELDLSELGILSLSRNLVFVMKRLGVTKARTAVETVMSLSWVTSPLPLLIRQDLYLQYVAPKLPKKPRGEQSEWSGVRNHGYQKIAL